ncbi:MAG TPA: glycosyltransferase [bacterium]|jgi:glycosyltransferase involved in cell wall biosynthesis|nr:glycosyltransferase [bacterium]HNZ51289.1 glycosyltransferase [bacterium]HOF79914.1 glycosyltransferase [bacterium]HOH85659.1 glycosyltransferase [bacterium]HOQ91600.1 glycosyltransferase [bacterium]
MSIADIYDLAIIFPCYNEANRVGRTVVAYRDYLLNQPSLSQQKVVLVFVNDGSTDHTSAVLNKFVGQPSANLTIQVVDYAVNRGKGGAIKAGVAAVQAKNYGFVDADLAYGPELLPAILDKLQHSDFVLAQRQHGLTANFYQRWRNFLSSSLQRVTNYLVGLPKIETQRGCKFFTAKVAREVILPTMENHFAFDVEAIARALQLKFRLSLIPVNFKHGLGSTVTWRDGWRYLLAVVAIADRRHRQTDRRFWWHLAGWLGLIIIALFGWLVVYGYFFADDFTWLWYGHKVGWSLTKIWTYRMSTFFSPVLNSFYTIFYHVFGYRASIYLLTGLIIHWINALLAGILAWQLSRSRLVAVLVSLMVAGVGGAYEPLVWIAANLHTIATLWILLALVSYQQFLTSGRRQWLVWSYLAALLVFGTKEIAIVVGPLLLVTALASWPAVKSRLADWFHRAYWLALLLVTIGYSWQQYLWQKDSIWVTAGHWHLSIDKIFKIPLVIADMLVPLLPLAKIINSHQAALLIVIISLVFLVIIWHYRRLRLVWLGLAWSLISIAPTLLFITARWWDPLASRYTYLPRLGIVLILAVIIQHHIVNNRRWRVISPMVLVIAGCLIAQLILMYQAIFQEYPFVYQAGRSLHQVLAQAAEHQPNKIYWRWGRPFETNHAHIIGAAATIANLEESQLIFLENGASEARDNGDVLIYWDGPAREYRLIVNYACSHGFCSDSGFITK